MPLPENELIERDSKRDIGAELLEAIRQVKAGSIGKVDWVPVAVSRGRIGGVEAMTIKISIHPKVVEALVNAHGGIDIGEIAAMALNTRAAQLGILDGILAEEEEGGG